MPGVRVAPGRAAPLRAKRSAHRGGGHRRAPRRRRLLRGRRVRLPRQLAGLALRLGRALEGRQPKRAVRVGARRAAVAVVVSDEADPAFAFIRRQERAGDPWSGQMAFPGGFRGSADEPLAVTASRETREETGLDLDAHGTLLGVLDELSPRTSVLPPLIVTPHVYVVSSRLALVPGDEAEEALWLAVQDLFGPANQCRFTLALPRGTREFPAIRIGDRIIWGLTERILQGVRDLADL